MILDMAPLVPFVEAAAPTVIANVDASVDGSIFSAEYPPELPPTPPAPTPAVPAAPLPPPPTAMAYASAALANSGGTDQAASLAVKVCSVYPPAMASRIAVPAVAASVAASLVAIALGSKLVSRFAIGSRNAANTLSNAVVILLPSIASIWRAASQEGVGTVVRIRRAVQPLGTS
jgi:hypothetical protein